MLKKILFFIVMFIPFSSTFAVDSPTFTDSSKTIVVQKNQKELVVTLKSNPTTGFSWLLKSYDHQLLDLESHQYIASSSKAIGAPGAEQFTFNIKNNAFKAPQLSQIEFSYARPWELSSAKDTIIHWVSIAG